MLDIRGENSGERTGGVTGVGTVVGVTRCGVAVL